MPYVPGTEGLNRHFLDIPELRERLGAAPWRQALVGTSNLRVILLHWEPGYATIPHHHPHAEEVFVPLEGRALFSVGDEPEREIKPGDVMLAVAGERHAIRVPADGGPFTLMTVVAPNQDLADETIE